MTRPILSDRELQLLRRQANGERYRDIAPSMFMSLTGVGSLSSRMIDRLGARNIAHAVHVAHLRGLLDEGPALVLPVPLVQVLELVADGRTNADIARILGRSEHTIADQVKEARRRLGARDRTHAAALAVALRIVQVQVPAAETPAVVDAA